jgi:hypothetical protein
MSEAHSRKVRTRNRQGGHSELCPKYGDPGTPAFKAAVEKGRPNEFTFEED